jgi:MtN3 and saliva related transmembrane protein
MEDLIIQFFGFMGGFLTAIAFVPQVWKSFTTKSTRDISLPWTITVTAGLSMWLVYAIMIESLPLLAANLFQVPMGISLIIMKMRYG